MNKEKIIFTNGCFDILHRGHVELFKYCKSLGGEVIIGLNSDKSIERIKGKDRPIVKEIDRKIILEAIKFIDSVVIFNEDTPYNLIKKIKPDVIVKGGDYNKEEVIGNDLSEVRIFNYVDGYSTTKIIKYIVNR